MFLIIFLLLLETLLGRRPLVMVNMEELAVLAKRLEVVTERLEAQAEARGGRPLEGKVGAGEGQLEMELEIELEMEIELELGYDQSSTL